MATDKKILVIDDEEDMVTWITTLLEDNGYTTIEANDGSAGFDKAKAEKPDLITLDVSMDKESGVKTLRRLQEDPDIKSIPVVMVTGVSTDIKRFIERDKKVQFPQGFIEKPIEKDEFLKVIADLLK